MGSTETSGLGPEKSECGHWCFEAWDTSAVQRTKEGAELFSCYLAQSKTLMPREGATGALQETMQRSLGPQTWQCTRHARALRLKPLFSQCLAGRFWRRFGGRWYIYISCVDCSADSVIMRQTAIMRRTAVNYVRPFQVLKGVGDFPYSAVLAMDASSSGALFASSETLTARTLLNMWEKKVLICCRKSVVQTCCLKNKPCFNLPQHDPNLWEKPRFANMSSENQTQ